MIIQHVLHAELCITTKLTIFNVASKNIKMWFAPCLIIYKDVPIFSTTDFRPTLYIDESVHIHFLQQITPTVYLNATLSWASYKSMYAPSTVCTNYCWHSSTFQAVFMAFEAIVSLGIFCVWDIKKLLAI